jgi:SEC-C motif
MNTDSAPNDLCRCGSGKPFRHCCGAVIPIIPAESAKPAIDAPATQAVVESGDVAAVANAARSCGGCTACCDGWLTGSIYGHELAPGKPCHFRGVGGCSIYADRPHDPCRGFSCGWLLKGSPFPESFRPDRLGVIIVVKPWRDRFAYVLVHAGRSPDAKLLEWMREHSIATGRPFLFHLEGRQRGYGSEEFQKEILEKSIRGEPLLPGLNPSGGGACKLMPLDPAMAGVGSATGEPDIS